MKKTPLFFFKSDLSQTTTCSSCQEISSNIKTSSQICKCAFTKIKTGLDNLRALTLTICRYKTLVCWCSLRVLVDYHTHRQNCLDQVCGLYLSQTILLHKNTCVCFLPSFLLGLEDFCLSHLRYKLTLSPICYSETCGGTPSAATVKSNGWWTGWRRPTLLFLLSTVPAPLNSRDAESTTSHLETSTASAQVSPSLFRTLLVVTSCFACRSILTLRYLPIDFAVYETFPFHSVSVESFEFNEDQFVVFAQPDSGFCTLYVWDHVEMVFRMFHNITCKLLAMKA